MIPDTIMQRTALWRTKIAEGTLSTEELVAVIVELRQIRQEAAIAEKATKLPRGKQITDTVKTAKPVKAANIEDLLSELDKL